MRKLTLLAVIFLCGLAYAQKGSTIIQAQNAGTTVYTGSGYVKINWTGGGCTASNVSGTLTVNCSGGGGTGTVSANNGNANAVAKYSAAAGSTTVGPDATLTDDGTTLTYSGGSGLATTLAGSTGYLWNNNAAPSGNLLIVNGANTSIFTTTTGVNQFFAWKNTTAALVGASQSSPIISFCGTEFHAAASVEGCGAFQFVPGTGTDAASTLAFTHSGTATGAVTTTFPGPISAGASGGVGGTLTLPEGTAPSASAGNDVCYADSTAHGIKCAYNNGAFFAITSPTENNLLGATAAGTITEGGAGFSVTRAGVATANLTAPWVIQNTNSTNNNTSITLGVTAPGTSTGQTVLNVNGASTGGDLQDWGTGGTWTAGVLSGQTIVASVLPTGGVVSKGTTAGFVDFPQGTTSAAVAPCNAATSICEQAPTSVTSYLVTKPGAGSPGLLAGTGTTTRTENYTGGAAFHLGPITIGSGSSISSTLLCSTTNCPAGDYDVAAYVEITTQCTTTGSYIVWLGWTDDGSAKTGSSTTTFFPFPLNGSGVPTTVGTIVPAAVGNYAQAHIFLHTTGAATNAQGAINYGSTAGACGTGGPMVGKMFLTVTPLS